MNKMDGVSKNVLRTKIHAGYDKVKGLFEANGRRDRGEFERDIASKLIEVRDAVLGVLDSIPGERVLYHEDLLAVSDEVRAGLRGLRKSLISTPFISLEKPLSVLVNTYTTDVCAEVRRNANFQNRPAEEELPEDDEEVGEISQDMYKLFEGCPDDVESFYLEQIVILETNWGRDVAARLRNMRFIGQSGADTEIISKDLLDIIVHFFQLVAAENDNLKLFMRHSYEAKGGCGFDSFRNYWGRLLKGVTETRIQAAFSTHREAERLVDVLHESLQSLIAVIGALDVDVFQQYQKGYEYDIHTPVALVMPKKHKYPLVDPDGNKEAVVDCSPAEHALKKHALKNGLENGEIAAMLNDVIHGGLPVRDEAFLGDRCAGKGSPIPPVLDPELSGVKLADVHGDILRSFAADVHAGILKKLLEKFFLNNRDDHAGPNSMSICINKREVEAMAEVGVLLRHAIQRYFAKLHGMVGNTRRLKRYFTEQVWQFERGLTDELAQSVSTCEDFAVYFGEADSFDFRQLNLDYGSLVAQLHDGKSVGGTEGACENDETGMVYAAMLGERHREDFDGPLYPQEVMLLKRYLDQVPFQKGLDAAGHLKEFVAQGKVGQWAQNINGSLHGGYPVRKESDFYPLITACLEEKLVAREREEKAKELMVVEERLSFMGGRIKNVLQWADEVQFVKRRRKGFLYDMVELYVSILGTVDLEKGRVACPIDVVEFQVLPFLEKVRANYEVTQAKRKSDDSGEEEDMRGFISLKLTPEDFAELMQEAPNKRVEVHESTPEIDKFAFVLKTLDQKIASCTEKLAEYAVILEALDGRKEVLRSKTVECSSLRESVESGTRRLEVVKMKIRALLYAEEPDETVLEPLVSEAETLQATAENMKALILRLGQETDDLCHEVEPFQKLQRDSTAVKTRLDQLMAKRKEFIAQVDVLISSLNYD